MIKATQPKTFIFLSDSSYKIHFTQSLRHSDNSAGRRNYRDPRYVIQKINKLHLKLQTRSFNLGELQSELRFCFNQILEVVSNPEKFDIFSFSSMKEINWEDKSTKDEWFLAPTPFMGKLAYRINKGFGSFIHIDNHDKASYLTENLQNFTAVLLTQLIKYLPWDDEIITATNIVVELKANYHHLEKKIIYLNQKFGIVEEDELKDCVLPQLLRLKTEDMSSYIEGNQESILKFWSAINKSKKFSNLMKIINFTQILPVSSSTVEQSFSVMKLFRTDQRNSLLEESLEGLMLLYQEYNSSKKIVISKKMIDLFKKIRGDINVRKDGKKRKSPVKSKDLSEVELQQIQQVVKKTKKTVNDQSQADSSGSSQTGTFS